VYSLLRVIIFWTRERKALCLNAVAFPQYSGHCRCKTSIARTYYDIQIYIFN